MLTSGIAGGYAQTCVSLGDIVLSTEPRPEAVKLCRRSDPFLVCWPSGQDYLYLSAVSTEERLTE
jgi:hypothetical protein